MSLKTTDVPMLIRKNLLCPECGKRGHIAEFRIYCKVCKKIACASLITLNSWVCIEHD